MRRFSRDEGQTSFGCPTPHRMEYQEAVGFPSKAFPPRLVGLSSPSTTATSSVRECLAESPDGRGCPKTCKARKWHESQEENRADEGAAAHPAGHPARCSSDPGDDPGPCEVRASVA